MAPKRPSNRKSRRPGYEPDRQRREERAAKQAAGRKTRSALAWAAAAGTLAPVPIGLGGHPTTAIKLGAIYTALLGAAQLINSSWRGREWWRDAELRTLLLGELAAAGLLPIIAAAVEFHFATLWWALLPWALPLAVLTLYYEHFEARLAQNRPENARSGVYRFANLPLPSETTPARLAKGSHGVPLGWFNRAVAEDRYQTQRAPHRRSASLPRRWMASALCAATVIPVSGAVATAFNPHDHHHHRSNSSGKPKSSGPGKKPASPRGTGRNNTGSGPMASAPAAWNGVCPAALGSTAPPWASSAIYKVIETQPGAYGTKIVGCPGTFTTTSGAAGRFTWALAANPDTQTVYSLVVDSTTWGATVYLQPAVASVESLIDKYGAIGGPARISVPADKPHWDMYLVNTAGGTFVLIRRTTNENYTLVAAAAVPLWLASMHAQQGWLWPLQVPGTQNTELINPTTNHTVYTMTYSPATGGYSDSAGAAIEGLPVDASEITVWDRSVR